jgi:transposase InsO family protein
VEAVIDRAHGLERDPGSGVVALAPVVLLADADDDEHVVPVEDHHVAGPRLRHARSGVAHLRASKATARTAVAAWIEYHHRQRRHSALGMSSLIDYERGLRARTERPPEQAA